MKTLPAVREAIELRRWDEAAAGIEATAAVLGSLTEQIDRATAVWAAVRPDERRQRSPPKPECLVHAFLVGESEPNLPARGRRWIPLVAQGQVQRDRNPYYEFMREVAPGDMIFSFADTESGPTALLVRTPMKQRNQKSWISRKELGRDRLARRCGVLRAADVLCPADWIERCVPCYLTAMRPSTIADTARRASTSPSFRTAGPHARGSRQRRCRGAARAANVGAAGSPVRIPEQSGGRTTFGRASRRPPITDTVKEALVLARRGQGLFRARVQTIETHCRVTRVDRPEHLRASHCKPWRDATNEERLDGDNGLLLTPTIDHLFDRGFISFDPDGHLLISPVSHAHHSRNGRAGGS